MNLDPNSRGSCENCGESDDNEDIGDCGYCWECCRSVCDHGDCDCFAEVAEAQP